MQTLAVTTCDTPFGPALVGVSDNALRWLALGTGDLRADAARRYTLVEGADLPLVRTIAAGLRVGSDLAYIAVDQPGTAFQQRVWAALRAIPRGETRSYGQIADALGTAPRAVGGACGANRVMIAVPCHRVIGADGALGGFAYGVDMKRALLGAERQPLRLAAA